VDEEEEERVRGEEDCFPSTADDEDEEERVVT
jgi:hypothetical protein